MKHRNLIYGAALAVAVALTAVVSVAASSGSGSSAELTTVASTPPLVGTWEVNAACAQYAPHLFEFAADQTMLSTNPTNVQQRATSPHGGTNDSVGMGTWRAAGANTYTGTFVELNADADDHKPAASLTVTFTIAVQANTFTGTAQATQAGQTHPAILTGTRIGAVAAAPSPTSTPSSCD